MNSDAALNVAEACVRSCIDFWGLDGSIKVVIKIGPTEDLSAAGECVTQFKYRRAVITLNPLHIEDWPELWQVTAHEMAHVVVGEFDHFHSVVETDEAQRTTYDYLRERTCVTLERVFLRERPYPGDEAFTAPKGDE